MRTPLPELKEKRDHKESVFLVTGGTGFLGSHISMALLKKGFRVIMLCRPAKNIPARARVEQLWDWLAPNDKTGIDRLEVIEGYIDEPNLGLPDKEYLHLAAIVSEIVHCAANTSFSAQKKPELERANLKSLDNIFKFTLTKTSSCYFLHHISTAYAAGKKTGICSETLCPTNEFNNIYEETKYQGEQYAWKNFPPEGIRVNIYRPAIVYGHTQTGRTFRFNALYYPLKVLDFLKKTLTRDIKEKGGEKSKEMGVILETDGTMHLPIRLENVPDGVIDLIPIDFFIDAFMAIMEESLKGDIFHIVSGAPKKLDEIITYTEKFFQVKGLCTVPKEAFERKPANSLETIFNSYLDLYGPYIRDRRRFDNSKAAAILQKRNMICPEFNYDIFARCMTYAAAVDWGKTLAF